jgi:hypothetical protein
MQRLPKCDPHAERNEKRQSQHDLGPDRPAFGAAPAGQVPLAPRGNRRRRHGS